MLFKCKSGFCSQRAVWEQDLGGCPEHRGSWQPELCPQQLLDAPGPEPGSSITPCSLPGEQFLGLALDRAFWP